MKEAAAHKANATAAYNAKSENTTASKMQFEKQVEEDNAMLETLRQKSKDDIAQACSCLMKLVVKVLTDRQHGQQPVVNASVLLDCL